MRILLTPMPRLLRDVVTSILQAESDLQLVGEAAGCGQISSVVTAEGADVVIVALQDGLLPPDCEQLICAHPHLAVVGLSDDGRCALRYQLLPHRVEVADVSRAGLLEAIRKAARSSFCR